jgi:hypothetical protein
MFSLLRPKPGRRGSGRRVEQEVQLEGPEPEPSPRPASGGAGRRYAERRHATADFTEADDDDDDDSNEAGLGQYGNEYAIDDEDGPGPQPAVLPLFSASYLGMVIRPVSIPVAP